MVFFRRSGVYTDYGGRRVPIYEKTSLFNSKVAINANEALSPLSDRATVVNLDIYRRTLTSALREVPFGAATPENLAIRSLLARHGYVSTAQVVNYERALFQAPHALYERDALEDEARSGGIHF